MNTKNEALEPTYPNNSQIELRRIFLYGVIITQSILLGSAIISLLALHCLAQYRHDIEPPKDDGAVATRNSIDTKTLDSSLIQFARKLYGQSAQVEYCLLKQEPFRNEASNYLQNLAWVRMQDTQTKSHYGVVKITYIKNDTYVIDDFVNVMDILSEPHLKNIVPPFMISKLAILLSRTNPKLALRPSDNQLKQHRLSKLAYLERLQKMLPEDKNLTYISSRQINTEMLSNQSLILSLKKTKLSKERFQQYLSLLGKAECLSISYGRKAEHPKGSNIWYQIWHPLCGEFVAKWLVYSKTGLAPQGCTPISSTDDFQALQTARLGCVKLDNHWYSVYGPTESPYPNKITN